MAQLVAQAVHVVTLLLDRLLDVLDLLAEARPLGLALELLLAHDRLDAVAERAHLRDGAAGLGVARGGLGLAVARPGEKVEARARGERGQHEQPHPHDGGHEASDGEEDAGSHRDAREMECWPTAGSMASWPSSMAVSNSRDSVAARASARSASGACTVIVKVSGSHTKRLDVR